MAEETMTALTALMREQNGIAQGTSKSIHDIVEETRAQNEKNRAKAEENIQSVKSLSTRMLEFIKGSNITKSILNSIKKSGEKSEGENEKSNFLLTKIQDYFDWSKKFQMEAAKAALRAASKLDPSKAVANVAQKAADFAKDILSLLVKGGLLFGLFKLLEYLSEKDPKELLAMAKEAYEKFLSQYQGWIDGVISLGAAAAVWKTAEWLTFGKGPVWLLWNTLKAIFAAGGLFASLATTVVKWTTSLIFGDESAIKKVWRTVRKIFGATGLFFDLLQIITTWTGSVIFDLVKSPIMGVWSAVKKVFGIGGKAENLAKTLDAVPTEMFDEGGSARRLFSRIKTFFGIGGKIDDAAKAVDAVPTEMFDEAGSIRRLFKRMSTFFGGEGKVAKGLSAVEKVADAEDFVGDASFLAKLFNYIKGFFGADGKIANGYNKIKNLIPDFTGEKGVLTRVFNSIGGIFGENSKLSTLSTKLGEWTNKFKSFFTFTEAAGDAKGASGISRLFGSIGGLFGKITGLVTSVTESSVFKGITKFFGTGLRWIGKIFAPIGWIMGFVEAVTGFWDGFSAKKGDERTLSERLLDGLAGAINGLIQFIFIDTIKLIQDVVNFGINQINRFAEFEILGKKITAFTPFEEVTFGDDLAKATENFIMDKIGSGKLQAAQEKESAVLELMEKQGLSEEDAIKRIENKLATKDPLVAPEAVTPIPEEKGTGTGAITQFTDARSSISSEKKTLLIPDSAQNPSDAVKQD